MKNLFQSKEKGFTLVELLVVVAIIATLTAIAVSAFTGLIGTGRPEAAAAELASVQTAVDAYMAVTHSSSSNMTARAAAVISPGELLTVPPYAYLRNVPTKHQYAWNNEGTVTQTLVP